MTFQSLSQPTNNTCGHTVVAMVAGVSVEDVLSTTPQRKLYPRDLAKSLSGFGWSMEKRHCCRLPSVPDGPAVMFGNYIVGHRLLGHFMLYDGAKFLDPSGVSRETLDGGWSGRFYKITKDQKGA